MSTWAERAEWHRKAHPEVYDHIVRLAREAKQRNMQKVGIELLINVLRWQESIGFCQNYAAHYARMIMKDEPDLSDFFNLRPRRRDLEDAEEMRQGGIYGS